MGLIVARSAPVPVRTDDEDGIELLQVAPNVSLPPPAVVVAVQTERSTLPPPPEPMLPPVASFSPSVTIVTAMTPVKDGMRDTTDAEKEMLWLQSRTRVVRDGWFFLGGLAVLELAFTLRLWHQL